MWSDLLNDSTDFFSKKRYKFTTRSFQEIIITDKYAGRLDLLARDFLGSKEYAWIIAEVNNIIDPFADVYVGVALKIPAVSDISTFENILVDSAEVTVTL